MIWCLLSLTHFHSVQTEWTKFNWYVRFSFCSLYEIIISRFDTIQRNCINREWQRIKNRIWCHNRTQPKWETYFKSQSNFLSHFINFVCDICSTKAKYDLSALIFLYLSIEAIEQPKSIYICMSVPLSWYAVRPIVTNRTKINRKWKKNDIILVSCNTDITMTTMRMTKHSSEVEHFLNSPMLWLAKASSPEHFSVRVEFDIWFIFSFGASRWYFSFALFQIDGSNIENQK